MITTTAVTNHHKKLERMYLSSPLHKDLYKGISIHVSNEGAEIALLVEPKFFHAAHAMHGSVYFKMLDDAAFFAVNSIVPDVFVYTVSFNVQLLRLVTKGQIRSRGKLKFRSNNLFIADAELWDENNTLVGRGSGNFMKSKMPLTEQIGYE
jgi:acyl-coenzyme A thioesterase PaaI-like protein